MQTQAEVLWERSKHQHPYIHLVQKSCEGFSLDTAFNSAFTWRQKSESHMGRLSDMAQMKDELRRSNHLAFVFFEDSDWLLEY